MNTGTGPLAIVSHILPPSPSGQAIVLSRLLGGGLPLRYCLLSREIGKSERGGEASAARLPVPHYRLKPAPRLPDGGKGPLSIVTTGINALVGILWRARQIGKIIRRERCRALIVCTGNLYDLPAGRLAAQRTGVPLVLYVFDDYLYQWTGFRRTIARRLEPALFRAARGVIVPNEFMQREYLERYGVESTIIRNPCPMPDLAGLDRMEKVFDEGEIAIVYAGAIYHAHYDAFRNLVAAIASIGRPEVKLHVYTSQPVAELKSNGICGPMVVFHPHIPPAEVPGMMRQATVLFLPLAFDSTIPEVIRTSAPGKTGEYLSVGRAILVHAPQDAFVCWYFREHSCGMVVDKSDPALLAEELFRLIADPGLRDTLGKAARITAERDFSLEKVRGRFMDFLYDCVGPEHEN